MCAVEWKKLGEVCRIMNGKDYKFLNEGNIPVYGSGGVMAYVDTFVYDRPSVLLPRKGSLNNVFYVDIPFWTVDTIYWTLINEELIEPKFFFYYMLMQNLEKLNFASGAVPSLTQAILNKIDIPIPSLAKQQEIVSQLDTFTTLISNLESELDMRRKQYEHYRNQLLDFEGVEGVEWKTLGDVCDFIRGPFGGALKKEMFEKEGYAIYEQQHAIYGIWLFRYFIDDDKFHQMKRFEVKAGDILMSCSGTMGKTSIVPENPTKGIINQALLKLSVKGIAINKFVKAFMDSSWFQKGLSQNTSGGAIQNVASVSILKNLEIPVPPLKTQQQIVEKLDAFEQLIQSLETEIKLRKQQYEYYREKLLTFD